MASIIWFMFDVELIPNIPHILISSYEFEFEDVVDSKDPVTELFAISLLNFSCNWFISC